METVTGEECRENDEDIDSEEEDVDTGEVDGEVTESEEEGGDEGKEEEGEAEERGEDGEENGVDARPAKRDPGEELGDVQFEKGRAPVDDGAGDPQGENNPPSRPSTALSRLSRSPPRSRSPSPDTLAKMTAALSLRAEDVRDRVAADLARRERQQRKYHTKRGAQRVGRPQGSKAKQDQRVKVDRGGFWE